ncbi:MAG: hypothetical protein IMZ62_06480, partial [Chloroflexi bacterium]|nr:hypothetical protein [Chloroflexota bacterium]
MTESYKSYVGVDNVYYALVTQDNVAGYVVGTPAYLAPAMKISKSIALSETLQWADNAVFDRLSGEGETTISCEVTGLSPQLAAILFGMTYDVATARVFDNGATPPDIALGFRGERSDGKYRYFWFLKGSFRKPKEEISTKSDKPELKSITVEFAAVKTTHPFELVDSGLTDGVKRVFGDTNDASFSATTWFNAVQVPSAGAPDALTCTPLPADAA